MLLVICTCSYIRRIPKLKQWFLSEKKGFAGIFYKGEKVKSLNVNIIEKLSIISILIIQKMLNHINFIGIK